MMPSHLLLSPQPACQPLLEDAVLGVQWVVHPRHLAVPRISLGLELHQALLEGAASTAASGTSRAGDGAHVPLAIDGNVREGEEDVPLPPVGL